MRAPPLPWSKTPSRLPGLVIARGVNQSALKAPFSRRRTWRMEWVMRCLHAIEAQALDRPTRNASEAGEVLCPFGRAGNARALRLPIPRRPTGLHSTPCPALSRLWSACFHSQLPAPCPCVPSFVGSLPFAFGIVERHWGGCSGYAPGPAAPARDAAGIPPSPVSPVSRLLSAWGGKTQRAGPLPFCALGSLPIKTREERGNREQTGLQIPRPGELR
jgi:hypothetical protein